MLVIRVAPHPDDGRSSSLSDVGESTDDSGGRPMGDGSRHQDPAASLDAGRTIVEEWT